MERAPLATHSSSEDEDKSNIGLLDEDETIAPEDAASFLSRFSFLWVQPLIRKGAKKTIVIEDIPRKQMPALHSSRSSGCEPHKHRQSLPTLYQATDGVARLRTFLESNPNGETFHFHHCITRTSGYVGSVQHSVFLVACSRRVCIRNTEQARLSMGITVWRCLDDFFSLCTAQGLRLRFFSSILTADSTGSVLEAF
jgi:hypothetical protein